MMVCMTIICDYVVHMKVKVADLKANLSQYLRRVRETGERIEVCVREDKVAYLTSAADGVPDAAAVRESDALRRRLHEAGLTLVYEGAARPLPDVKASMAGDRRTDVATVAAMRAEKGW